MFYGVHASFDDAQRSIPTNAPQGYDVPGGGDRYVERTRQIYPADYPVMVWLGKAFSEGETRVADLGGHIGVAYYAYRPLLCFPETLSWTVFDLPQVIARGRQFAQEHDKHGQLDFIDDLARAGAASILLASGSLQYTKRSLTDHLRQLPQLPKWVILSQLPVHDSQTYYTVQCLGFTYCPYRVICRLELEEQMRSIGYDIADRWDNLEKRLELTTIPERSLDSYAGYCFRRSD